MPLICTPLEAVFVWARAREIPNLDFGALPHNEWRDAAENRRWVLAVARKLFEERGVDAVSMHEIGCAAGVGQGTLYRRYGHKGKLCAALLFESPERLYEGVGERSEGDEPALVQLWSLLEDLAAFNEENAPLLGAIRDAAGGERHVEMYRNPFYGWLRGTVTVFLRRAAAEGMLRAPGRRVRRRRRSCAAEHRPLPLPMARARYGAGAHFPSPARPFVRWATE